MAVGRVGERGRAAAGPSLLPSSPTFPSLSRPADYDLTGQVVWPGAHLLASHLASPAGRAVCAKAGTACELGAGVGLAGLAAVEAGCGHVLLTDGEPAVLTVLARNAATAGPRASAMHLPWDSAAALDAVRATSPGGAGFPLLLGADVAYSLAALPDLFGAAAALLAPGGAFLLGYVSRSGALDAAVPAAAAAVGLVAAPVPGTEALLACGVLTGRVLEIRWSGGRGAGGGQGG